MKQQMKTFIRELRRLTGVSDAYAVAAWYTMNHPDNPAAAALEYYHRFFEMSLRSS